MPTSSGDLATQAHQTGADILAQLEEAIASNDVNTLKAAAHDAIQEIQRIVSDFEGRFSEAQQDRQQEIDRIKASIGA